MSNVIYIGATLKTEGVMHNELFTDKPAELIERLKGSYPLIELMFVNVAELSAASVEVQTAGSARAKAYEQTKNKAVGK